VLFADSFHVNVFAFGFPAIIALGVGNSNNFYVVGRSMAISIELTFDRNYPQFHLGISLFSWPVDFSVTLTSLNVTNSCL
jgi:hypothetical protein